MESKGKDVVKSARDIPRGNIDRGYGHLPADKLDDWAMHQANLSEQYVEGSIPAVSGTMEGRNRKNAMMLRINEALTTRSDFDEATIAKRMHEAETLLEDPGLLENFEYFDIPSSDFMLQFYFAVWDRRIAEAMDFLHNYGKDLKGVAHEVPEDDIWYQMSFFEGMNIDKRRQAKSVVDFIKSHHITKATSFGGGHIPERLHGLPHDLNLTVFDNGPVNSLEELFPDKKQRGHVNYIHESLAGASKHRELLNTQELVWMHGVSMYLNEEDFEMTGAILCAAALLQPGGFMRYDYLINNASMRRVISTQCWPGAGPNRPLALFDNADSAIQQGRKTLAAVNHKLGGKAFMDVANIDVNLIEPWGVTCVYFTIQKHA